jgi:hypothetical protein
VFHTSLVVSLSDLSVGGRPRKKHEEDDGEVIWSCRSQGLIWVAREGNE